MVINLMLSGFFAAFSTVVMSYIAMATPVGPWIAPTIVLMAMGIVKFLYKKDLVSESQSLIVVSASIGGIMATACGFVFPALYFLEKELFLEWLASPLKFITIVSSLSFVAGWLGLWLANCTAENLIQEQELPFPIGKMVYKLINAHTSLKKSYELLVGFCVTIIFCSLQQGSAILVELIPRSLLLLPAVSFGILKIPAIAVQLRPMFWAIGFVTGIKIMAGLFVGSLAKIFIIDPMHSLFFSSLDQMEFVLAFCSGMVVAGVLSSFIGLKKHIVDFFSSDKACSINMIRNFFSHKKYACSIELAIILMLSMAFFYYFEFGFFVQVYTLIFSSICAYQIALIAGKIGLAQLGRFATFVMVPALIFFKVNYVQAIIIATFVELTGGVMTDVLFGRKLAALANISSTKVRQYQYFGLVVSSIFVGIVFWFLVSHFELGGVELFVQRAQARALLVQVQTFNIYALGVGFIFGLLLKLSPLSPMLVFGGILMPIELILSFIVGALITLITKNTQRWIPMWSGVFAANSIWIIFYAVLKFLK